MKVLYVCNYESPYRIDFWNALTDYCDVTVLFTETKAQQGERDSRWFSDQKYRFNAGMLKQTRLPGGRHICLGVTRYLKDRSYDLVIFHPYSPISCMYGIWYCIRHGIPYVINSDGGFAKDGRGFQERLKRYLISHASAFTSTAKLTDDYLAFYGGNRDRMYRYTLTTVREKDLEAAPATSDEKRMLREKLGIGEGKVVITVGNMIPRKGFDLLLKAARDIDRETGIYIVGGAPTPEYLRYREENHLDNVHFVDFMDKARLHEYYRASDLFVLPTREDIWGLVVVEAMSCGLPVITTDRCIAGMELIRQGVNGYIYPVNDTAALASLITSALSDPGRLEALSRATVEGIRGTCVESMTARHYEIFQQIIRDTKGERK